MLRKVKVKEIGPNPFQVRKDDEEHTIESLAEEIQAVGLWTGALRGREENGHVELCFGHRRLKAVKRLGWKEVEVDVVALSDLDMATQGLIENLQRQGLNDADKGDGIAAYIKLRQKSGITSQEVIWEELCRLLGLSKGWMQSLVRIASFSEPIKSKIREGEIAGKTAGRAMEIGGEEFVQTVIEKDLPYQTVEKLGRELGAIPHEKVKEKVRRKVVSGEIKTPDEVRTRAKQIHAQSQRSEHVPPDLIDVMRAWTTHAQRWSGELDQVVPYIDYIDREPAAAQRWRAAVKVLIEKLQKCI
jgi:ParB family chromosome partitioning protein